MLAPVSSRLTYGNDIEETHVLFLRYWMLYVKLKRECRFQGFAVGPIRCSDNPIHADPGAAPNTPYMHASKGEYLRVM